MHTKFAHVAHVVKRPHEVCPCSVWSNDHHHRTPLAATTYLHPLHDHQMTRAYPCSGRRLTPHGHQLTPDHHLPDPGSQPLLTYIRLTTTSRHTLHYLPDYHHLLTTGLLLAGTTDLHLPHDRRPPFPLPVISRAWGAASPQMPIHF